MKNALIKKVLMLILCSSQVPGLVGCAADGGLSVRRDNSFSAVSEALQKGIEAENERKATESGLNKEDVSITGEAVGKDPEFSSGVGDMRNDSASGEETGDDSGEEIFYKGDEWLDTAFENALIDRDSEGLRSEEQPENSPGFSDSSVSADGIDVDLTQMSATMVYAEVYNIMVNPDRYIGKTIKADGEFAAYLDESTGKMYYACIIKDATACCAQGLEFAPADEKKYPDDFPAEGDEVCVVGVFDTYMEGEDTYGVLKDAIML
ncbi:MAG: hypothetical protein J5499_04925 [Lachnospiraceae bacterium]|nr:hypothetical protein [Lachnospiraceae bacterium]